MMNKHKKEHADQQENLIIYHPDAMSKVRRSTEFGITTVGWMVWVFFFRPVMIVILWYMGFSFFYEHMIALKGLQGLIAMWKVYMGVILTILVIIKGWSVYNRLRFRSKNRRANVRPMNPEELEKFFHMAKANAAKIQAMDNIAIDFAANHEIGIHPIGQAASPTMGYFKPS